MYLKKTITGDPWTERSIADWVAENIEHNKFAIFNARHACVGAEHFKNFCQTLSSLLGTPVIQNADGATLVEVYDRRVGTIKSGARYHQTRQGGDIHIDSVNGMAPFRYLLLACVAPAVVGGETILVKAIDVLERLAQVPIAFRVLQKPFWFEERGMSHDEVRLFQMPVLSLDGGVPKFRYLRSYIESAHRKAGRSISDEQNYAFDALDAILEDSAIQYRRHLLAGDILVTIDIEVFHGRTSFADSFNSGAVSLCGNQRKMYRVWVE